jgi:hypothetical protein
VLEPVYIVPVRFPTDPFKKKFIKIFKDTFYLSNTKNTSP